MGLLESKLFQKDQFKIIDKLYKYDKEFVIINIINPLFTNLKLNIKKKKNNKGFNLMCLKKYDFYNFV